MDDSIYILDNFVSVTAGEPYRLFPFGRIVKNGKVREITRAFAEKIKLPHFKPPIKLGSHNDETPAGGFIVGLEVRDDGLYAVPEWNDSGNTAINTGAYRYHSPEIIWEGRFEHPETGEEIAGPLIVGDALLHTPHLGEAAALYSIEPISEKKDGTDMSENTVTVPAGFWDKLTARLFDDQKPEPEPQEPDTSQVDEYAVKVDNLTAKIQELEDEKVEMEAEKELKARVDAFAVEFKDSPLADNADLFGVLAELDEKQAEAITREFKALSEQAKLANLDKDIGGSGTNGDNPVEKFNAAVNAKMEGNEGMTRDAAIMAVAKETPELITAARGGK